MRYAYTLNIYLVVFKIRCSKKSKYIRIIADEKLKAEWEMQNSFS